MRNKMIGIVGVIVVLFVALFIVNNVKNKQALEDNPYGKDSLHQATIDQLDDPLYQNQLTPEKLAGKLQDEPSLTVYFYDPLCIHCLNTTPVLVPLAEDLGVDIQKLNLLEFNEKQAYAIQGTPTLVHYEDGQEVGRISGEHTEEAFQEFFEEYILKEQS